MALDIQRLFQENRALKMQMSTYRMKMQNQEKIVKMYEDNFEKKVNEAVNLAVSKVKAEYEIIIKGLNNKIAKLESRLKTNSSNSSLPSSKDAINASIPNLRIKSNKAIGGQKGHKQNKLEYFKEEEIDEILDHTLEKCPKCNGKLEFKSQVISDIIDFDIKVKRTRNNIYNYKCPSCREEICSNTILPRGASYGDNVNASALILMNDANVPINKVRKYIDGITAGEIIMSEGYIAKLQVRTAKNIENFYQELKNYILKEKIVHWDDTVIKIGTKQGCLRFYGNDLLAYLVSHENKGKEGLEADNILANLSEETTVMHDHLLYNYNPDFFFKNSECNAHILRYLQGVTDNIHDHTWESEMSKLLKEANDNRAGKKSYEESYINEIYARYDEIIKLGQKENESLVPYHFYKIEEEKLIKRLEKYKDAHLLFIKDFAVPFSNNTAERSFRISKTKIKVSGLFQNIATANNYAKILSYMETCYRNGITKHQAIKRLLDGNPYTINELIKVNQ